MFNPNANTLCNNSLFNPASMAFMADDYDRLFHAVQTLHPEIDVSGPSALARFLGESPQQMTNWKKRGLPNGKLTKLARKAGCRREYLEFGELPLVETGGGRDEGKPAAELPAEDPTAAAYGLAVHLDAIRQTAKGVADAFGMSLDEVLYAVASAGKAKPAGAPKEAVSGVRVIDSNKPIPRGRLSITATGDASPRTIRGSQ